MEQSPFIKHFPYIIKVCTSLSVNSGRFNNYLLSVKLLADVFFFLSTISCMSDREELSDSLSKYHDLLILILTISVEVFLVKNKSQVCTLISFLMEPFEEFDPITVQSEIVKDYNREVTLYGKIVTTLFVCCTPFYSVTPTLLLFYKPTQGQCSDLAFGWVWNVESNWFILLSHIGSIIVCLTSSIIVLLWYLFMVYVILKIKFTIRLICVDLYDLNRMIDWSEERFEPSSSGGNSMYWEEDSTIRTAPRTNDSRENEADRPENDESKEGQMNLELQTYSNEKMQRERIKLYLANIIERHVNVIRYVKLTDSNFRPQMLVFFQLGAIALALAVPKLSLGINLLRIEYISRSIEVFAFMTVLGVVNYFGQILLDESESLRQALYSCDWTDKPHSLRRDLLIMQTVATKPLKLTVGGIYTLGMETYSNITGAAYSYSSLIQSLN